MGPRLDITRITSLGSPSFKGGGLPGIEGYCGDGGLVGISIYALVNSILFRYLLIRIVICLSSLGLCLYALILF